MEALNDLVVYALQKNMLFAGVEKDQLVDLISNIRISIQSYRKETTLFLEGDSCGSLGIVLEGVVELQNIYPSGKIAKMVRLSKGNTFGEAILFSSKSTYPVTVVAEQNVKVAFIEKGELVKLLEKCPEALENYLSILSNRLVMMSGKIRLLSMGTIREKVCQFLIEESVKQKSRRIRLKMTKKDMADFMAVQRPSLSRELSVMEAEGMITVERDSIEIVDMDAIEAILNT